MSRPPELRSALYEGTVTHRRPGPAGHGFDQSVRMALIDLNEVGRLCEVHPLWSSRHPAPVRFRRSDYLGPSTTPLMESVGDIVEQHTGQRPAGPISVLTNLRTWGWLFNPISCYFCFAPDGVEVVAMVAEVTNTPWHERHCYVVGPPGAHEIVKELHVSPFLEMEQTYRLDYSAPGATLSVRFGVFGPDGPSLFAGVQLKRRQVNRRSLGQMVWEPALGAPGVSLGIYRQAFALWRKGAQIHPHRVLTSAMGRAQRPSYGIDVMTVPAREASGG